MDDLREFYNSIENPIDNKYKWNSLLNLYCSSYDFNDFYEKVTYINKSTNPYYMNDDKENFSLLMFDLFKKSIVSLSEDKVKHYISKEIFNSKIYDIIPYLNTLPEITEYSKLKEVLNDEFIRVYFSKFFYDENGYVILASDFDVINDYTYNTVFTITVGGVNLYKFLKDFVSVSIENEMTFYLKLNEFGKYINVNIYTSLDKISKLRKIINTTKKENYAFHYDNIYNLLSGNIDESLSIRNRSFYNKNDYNNSRCLILFKSFDSVIYNYVINHLNILVSYKDGRMNLSDYISNSVAERIMHELISKNVKTESDYYNIANSGELIRMKELIKDKVAASLKDVLKDRLYLKDNDAKVTIYLSENKSLDIDVSIYMYAIRTLTSPLIIKDNSIEKAFRIRIKNECEYEKIDSNKFCLDKSFSNRILYDEDKIKKYEEEMESVQKELDRLNELDKLFEDGSPEAKARIASEMKDLIGEE